MMLGPVQTLTFEDVRGLIREARRQGFYIGPDQVISMSQVVLELTGDPERPFQPDHLKTALGAIICKSPNEQAAFYQIFERWYRQHMAETLREAGQRRAARALTETDLPQSRPLPFIALAATIIAAVFFGSIYYYLYWPETTTDDTEVASVDQPDGGTGDQTDQGTDGDATTGDGTDTGPDVTDDGDLDDEDKEDKGDAGDGAQVPDKDQPTDTTDKVDQAGDGTGDSTDGTDGTDTGTDGDTQTGDGTDGTDTGPGPDTGDSTQGSDNGGTDGGSDGTAGTDTGGGSDGTGTGDGTPDRIDVPQLAAPTVVAAQAPQEAGWWDAYSIYFLALRNALAATPLVAFFAWLLWRWTSRQAWMERRAERDPPELTNLRISRPKNSLFGSRSYTRALQLLRRHHRRPTRNLDVEETMLATVKRVGLFSPVYETRQTSPEYLVLADRSTLSDHQAHLIRELVLQSKSEQLYIDLYYFDGDPRICYTEKGRLDTITLEELAARHAAQRLLIAADGAALFDPVRGAPRAWTQMFSAWRERALIVPQTSDRWGAQQAALHGAGFGIIPLDESGLMSLAEAFEESGAASGEFTPPYLRPPVPPGSEYPDLLVDADDLWMDPDAPVSHETLAHLRGELRNYLGAKGYELLCACATFPQPHWDVTLYLDQVLHEDDAGAREKRLVMLAQLPWFRRGQMPDYLRLMFVRELPSEREVAVKIALQELLHSALEAPPGAAEIEVAHGAHRGLKRIISDFFQFGTPQDYDALHDHIFIRFVLDGKPGPLDIELPRILQKILPWKGWDSFTARAAMHGLAGLVCAVALWTVFTMFEGPMRGVSVLSAQTSTTLSDTVRFAAADSTDEGVQIQSLEFSPTENRFLAVDATGTVLLGTADEQGIRSSRIEGLKATMAQFIAGGQEVLVRQTDGTAALYRVKSLEQGYVEVSREVETAERHVLSPSRTHLITTTGTSVRYIRFGQFQKPQAAFTHPEPIEQVAMDPEGTTISAVSRNYLSVFNLATSVHTVLAFGQGHHDLIGDASSTHLWQVNQSRIVVHYDNGNVMELENQNSTVVTYPQDGMGDAGQMRTASTLWGHEARHYHIQYGAGAHHLMAWHAAGDDESERAVNAYRGHGGAVTSALVDRTGRYAVSLSRDGTARVWDLTGRDEVAVLRGTSGTLSLAALTPDNQHLLTISDDGGMQLWNLSEVLEATEVPPIPSEEPIFIAVAGQYEGDAGVAMSRTHESVLALVDAINEQQGVIDRRVVVIRAEDGCDPERALAEAETLKERGVRFVIGHPCPGVSQAVAQRYADYGIVHISLAPPPSEAGGDEADDTTFFLRARFGDREGEIAGAMLAESFGASRIAILHDGSAQRRGLARQVKFALNRRGVREVVFDAFEADADEADLVDHLQAENIEVIYLAASHSAAGLIVRIAQSRDFHPQLVTSSALQNSAFGEIAGEEGNGTLMLVPNEAALPPDAPEMQPYRLHMALLTWAEAATEANTDEAGAVSAALADRLASDYAWSADFPPFVFPENTPQPYVWHVWDGGSHQLHVTRSMALLVGVDSYENYDDLEVAATDLEDMTEFVQDNLDIEESDIIVLRGAAARRRDVVAAMRRLSTFTGPGDRVIVYFAARGSQVADDSGEERDGMDETILLYDAARDGSADNHLTDDEFDVMLDRLAGRDITVILETDHSARVADDGRDERVRRAEAIFVDAGPGRRIWSAASPLQLARSDENGSVFTRLFIAGAGEEAQADFNRDGVVTNAEQFDHVRNEAYVWCAERPTCRSAGLTPWLEAAPEDFARALVPPDAETPQAEGAADARLPRPENVYGIIVGIDVYANLDDIQGAVADAQDIHSALLESGVPPENLMLILDSNATRPNILEAWRRVLERTQPGDTVMFTYAGHGLQLDAAPGAEQDGKDEAIALTGYLGATEDVIRDNDLRALVEEASDVRVVMLADTEWAGDLTDSGEGNNSLPDNVIYMSAVEDGTSMSVYTVDGVPRGALSWAFANAVRGGSDADRNLVIDTRELENYVREQVLALSQNTQKIVFIPRGRSLDNVLAVRDEAVAVPELERPLKVYVMGGGEADALIQQLHNVTLSEMQQAELILDMRSGQLLVGRDVVTAVDPVMAPSQIQPIVNRWLLMRDLAGLSERTNPGMTLRRERSNYDRGTRVDLRFDSPAHSELTIVYVDPRGLVRQVRDEAGARQTSFTLPAATSAPANISVWLPDDAPDGLGNLAAILTDAGASPFAALEFADDGTARAGEFLTLLHETSAAGSWQFGSLPVRVEPLISPPPGGKLSEEESLTEGLVFQFGHSNQVNSVAFTPDGRYAVSGGSDGVVNVWDVQQRLLVDSIHADLGAINAVALTPDGRFLLASGAVGKVRVWRMDNLRRAYEFTGLEQAVTAIAVSLDGRRVAAGGADHVIAIWDFETGERLATLEGHTDWIRAIEFSPDGRFVATGSDDRTAVLWEAATGRRVRAFDGHENWVLSVAFSPDGSRLLTASTDQTMRLWDVATGAELTRYTDYTDWVRVAAFSPDGRQAMSADDTNEIKIRNLQDGKVQTVFQGHTGWIFSARYSTDGATIVSGGADQTVRLWDVASGEALHVFGGLSSIVTAATFSDDSQTVLTASNDGSLRFWSVRNGRLAATVHAARLPITHLAAMPGGRHALIDEGLDISMVDTGTGEQVRRFEGGTSQILKIVVSSDGDLVASSSSDRQIRIWNVETGELVHTLAHHQDWVRDLAFSPDGRFIYSASDDRTIVQWDTASGALLRTFEGHTDWVRSIAVSPDGSLLVSGSDDNTLKVWEVETGTVVRTIEEAGVASLGLFFMPDGTAVIASDGTSLSKWNIASGEKIGSFDGGLGGHKDVTVSPDGLMLATASDHGVSLWRADTPAPLAVLIAIDESDFLIRLADGRWTGSADAIERHVVWFDGFNRLSTPATEHPSFFGSSDDIDFLAGPVE